jgi:hypothetical protein
VSHKHAREREQRNTNPAALPDLHTSSGDNVLFCPLSVRYPLSARSREFPQTGGCYLLKYNGGDSGIKISVLYWRCSLLECPLLEVPLYFELSLIDVINVFALIILATLYNLARRISTPSLLPAFLKYLPNL